MASETQRNERCDSLIQVGVSGEWATPVDGSSLLGLVSLVVLMRRWERLEEEEQKLLQKPEVLGRLLGCQGPWSDRSGSSGVLPPTCQEQPQGFQKSYSFSCSLSSLD